MSGCCPRCAGIPDEDLDLVRNRPISRAVLERLTPTERIVADLLLAAWPFLVPSEELCEAIQDRMHGHAVRMTVSRMRPRLPPGVRIENQPNVGYRLKVDHQAVSECAVTIKGNPIARKKPVEPLFTPNPGERRCHGCREVFAEADMLAVHLVGFFCPPCYRKYLDRLCGERSEA